MVVVAVVWSCYWYCSSAMVMSRRKKRLQSSFHRLLVVATSGIMPWSARDKAPDAVKLHGREGLNDPKTLITKVRKAFTEEQ
jgi:hypothetical protein